MATKQAFVPATREEIERVSRRLANSTEQLSVANLDFIRVSKDGVFQYSQDGEPHIDQSISGIILTTEVIRRYVTGEGDAAQFICSSEGGIQGWGDPLNAGSDDWHNCDTCPMNQWGSADRGRGKACREKRRLFLMLSNSRLPRVMEIPPTSLGNWGTYVTSVFNADKDLEEVVTTFTLKEAGSGTMRYSVMNFAFDDVLDGEQKSLYSDMRSSVSNLFGATNGSNVLTAGAAPAQAAIAAPAQAPVQEAPSAFAEEEAPQTDYSDQEYVPPMDLQFTDENN